MTKSLYIKGSSSYNRFNLHCLPFNDFLSKYAQILLYQQKISKSYLLKFIYSQLFLQIDSF
nr:MAG TPA: hypothetical protein [Caudoviricetes sp.]